jgi:hypothetical protein
MGDLILHFWFELGNKRAILLGFVDIIPSGYTIVGTSEKFIADCKSAHYYRY